MVNKTLPSIHFSQGSLLIGAYCNLILYTLDVIGFYLYFHSKRSKNDSLPLKSIIILAAFIDLLGTVATLAVCYILCINYSRHDITIEAPIWSLCIWWVCNIISSFLVQSFMIRRFWHLSKNTIVASLISLLMLASKATMMYVGIVTWTKARNLRTRHQDIASVTIALGSTAATDIFISIALILQLASWSNRAHTDSARRMIRTIASMAITTGGATSAISIIELIFFAAFPAMRMSTGVGFVTGRVYTATMLFTLLYRERISDMRHSVHVNPETSNRTDLENGLQTPALVHFKPHLDTLHIESTNIYTDSSNPTYRGDLGIRTSDTLRFAQSSNLNLPTPIDDSDIVLAHPVKNDEKLSPESTFTRST